MPTTPPPAPPAPTGGISIPERLSSGQMFAYINDAAIEVARSVYPVGSDLLLYYSALALMMVGFKTMLAAHSGQHENPLASLITWTICTGIAYTLLVLHGQIMQVVLQSQVYISAKLGLAHDQNIVTVIKTALKPFSDLMRQREDIGSISAWTETEMFFKAHLALFAMRALAFLLIFVFIGVGLLVIVLSMLPMVIFSLMVALGPILIPFLVLQPHIQQFGSIFWNYISLIMTATFWVILNVAWLKVAQQAIAGLNGQGGLITITPGRDLVINWELLIISLIVMKLTLAAQFMLPFIAMQLGGARMGGKTR